MGKRTPRSVADDIRSRSVEQLKVLLVNRPDLVNPVPADLTELAARVTNPTSVRMALDNLDKRQLTLLRELSSQSGVGSLTAHIQSSGVETDGLTELWDRALLWGQPPSDPSAAVFVAGPVHAILGEAFGRGADTMNDEEAELASLDEVLKSADKPGEIAEPDFVEINEPSQVSASQVAMHSVVVVDDVAHWIRSARPSIRKSGGIGIRDLTSLTNDLALDSEQACFWLELSAQAGFFGLASTDSWGAAFEVVLTESFTAWSRLSFMNQWLELARVWSTTDSAPQLINTETPDGERINVLSGKAKRSVAPSVRMTVLRAMAGISPGQGYDEPGIQLLGEQRFPRLDWKIRQDVVRQVLAEGEWLGVVARTNASGTQPVWFLTDLGRAWNDLRNGGDEDSEDNNVVGDATGDERGVDHQDAVQQQAIEELFPAEVDQLIAQADMTCVVPGPPSPELRQLLGLISHRESTGGATVYRLTPATIRAGLALGADPHEVLSDLERKSLTPIPQPMQYLVLDSAKSVAATRDSDSVDATEVAKGVTGQARAQRSLDGYVSAVGNSNAGFGVPLPSGKAEDLAAKLWQAHHDKTAKPVGETNG